MSGEVVAEGAAEGLAEMKLRRRALIQASAERMMEFRGSRRAQQEEESGASATASARAELESAQLDLPLPLQEGKWPGGDS